MTYIERIVNADTNEVIEKPYTKEQIAEVDIAKNRLKQMQNNEVANAAARQAILDRLGLTADEAALLLGAK